MRQSPLHNLNQRLGARLVDFGGWDMPVQYDSVLGEHRAVRQSAGWFDVSHLGRFAVHGDDGLRALIFLLSNNVAGMGVGKTQYNLLLNQDGGIDDDLLVWRWEEDLFWVLPNAATHEMVLDRFRSHAPGADLVDLRESTAMVAVQGPSAPDVLTEVLGAAPKRFSTARAGELWMAGTGYTGERGGEVVGQPDAVKEFVELLIEGGIRPCGLGSRDTLRLEAGLLLAGQDFDATVKPIEAGLEWAVNWDHEFLGREALVAHGDPERRLLAFTLPGRSIPRHGCRIRTPQGSGEVTSGNFSPMLECGIGLGYMSPPYRGGDLEVEIRGVWVEAKEAEIPFYRP